MLDTISNSFQTALKKIKFNDDEKALKKALDELKKSLLKADVYHKVVKDLLRHVELDTKKDGIGKESFLKALKSNLTTILTVEGNQGFIYASKPPTIVLMNGLQGSGKTTTTGKLGHYLKLRKKKVLVAGADLQRLAAVEQLRQVSESVEVDFFGEEGATSPVDIATRAVQKAKDGLYDVVIIDTAGRLAIDEELMSELKAIKEAINPDETFYVADSLTGQDSVRSASTFHENLGLTGVILTKFDGDSKGGVALGIASQVGVPLRFVGIGEKLQDLEAFMPDRIVKRLMGDGDIESLAEKTSLVMDEKQVKKINKKIKKGTFNFNDFVEQLESVKKLGNLKSLVGMIPGMGDMATKLKETDLDNSDEIKKIKAMISSMTVKEREDPALLNGSRKRRIARGCGLEIMEVNRILKQFNQAAKFAKKFSGKKGMQDLQNMMGQQRGFPR